MRTLAQKQNRTQERVSSGLARSNMTARGPVHCDRADLLYLQRTIGNQAARQILQTDAEDLKAGLTVAAPPHFVHDFSRIPAAGAAMAVVATIEDEAKR